MGPPCNKKADLLFNLACSRAHPEEDLRPFIITRKEEQAVHSVIMCLKSNQCYGSDYVVPTDGIGTVNGQARDSGNKFILTPSRETVAADLPVSQKMGAEMVFCPSPSWLSSLTRRRRRRRGMTGMGGCHTPCPPRVPPSPRCTCLRRIVDAE